MSKTQRNEPEFRIRPRTVKRLRQREAMSQYRPLDYPQPEPPIWKPLG